MTYPAVGIPNSHDRADGDLSDIKDDILLASLGGDARSAQW
jgi:hypothetical protein